MNENIFTAEDLPEYAKVYLKKDGSVYRVVHPIKNEDGFINWFNLFTGGSWRIFIMNIVVMVLILAFLFEYSSNINLLQEQVASCVVIDTSFT